MLIKMRSVLSYNVSERDIQITEEEYNKILLNKNQINDIVPHLSDFEKEYLSTGMTEDEQKLLFKNLKNEL